MVPGDSARLADERGWEIVPGSDSTWFDQYRELSIAIIRAKREALLRARTRSWP